MFGVRSAACAIVKYDSSLRTLHFEHKKAVKATPFAYRVPASTVMPKDDQAILQKEESSLLRLLLPFSLHNRRKYAL